MANAGNIIGNVTVLVGHATVRSTDGSVRTLQLGDAIHEGDVIVTEDGGKVEIAFNDGHSYILGGNETLTVDAQVYAPAATATHDAALLPATGELADVTQAIISGKGSLDELLEETAASLSGGGDDNGSSFVELLRITENAHPGRKQHHHRRHRNTSPVRDRQRQRHHAAAGTISVDLPDTVAPGASSSAISITGSTTSVMRWQHCHAAGAGQRSGHRRRGRHRRHQCGRQLQRQRRPVRPRARQPDRHRHRRRPERQQHERQRYCRQAQRPAKQPAPADTVAAAEDTPVTISPSTLLANDGDADNDGLTITSVQGAVNGSVAIVGGNVVFTPEPELQRSGIVHLHRQRRPGRQRNVDRQRHRRRRQ
ncbi:retention module-containing protein [Massilia sp. H-1]|nr:retention module-containing protein [Massilia sp. H-1]